MSALLPLQTSVADLCTAALKEGGMLGIGQTPNSEELADAWERFQWMTQKWNKSRWLVYEKITQVITSTGAQSYAVGPGGGAVGGFETGANTPASAGPPATPLLANSQRPDHITSAFVRQPGQSGGLPIDYPLEILESMEDYNRIALKTMVSFPGAVYYQASYPLGTLYVYPIAQANIYSLGIAWNVNLPLQFLNQASLISLPFEYYDAIVLNLALRLRPKYSIRAQPGDPLAMLAKGALSVIKGANTQIAQLSLPGELSRPGIYNIFSDRTY